MAIERRKSPRVKVNLPARWEGALTHQLATITSISMNGCFVLSGGQVELRELIRMEIYLSDDVQIFPWAVVVEQATEIGFAVKFSSLDADDNKRLKDFMNAALATS
jgi:hypothetical protein